MVSDVDRYVLEALRQIGGEVKLVPGARVAATAISIAQRDGVDFKQALLGMGLKFSDLARRVASAHGLRLVDRAGTDFLLGYKDATEPLPRRGESIPRRVRKDFYEAFSHVRQTDLYYLPDQDRIVSSVPAPPGGVLVPSPTLENVWKAREAFAEQTKDETKRRFLLDVAHNPNRSFRAFSDLVRMYDLQDQWQTFQFVSLQDAIIKWAEKSALPVRDSWLYQRPPSEAIASQGTPTLAALLAVLNDAELARVMVPADVIQAALARLEARR